VLRTQRWAASATGWYVRAVQQDPARRRGQQPGEHPQQSRLAATARTEQRDELSVLDGQVDSVDRDRWER
jgi:hypothetical protein